MNVPFVRVPACTAPPATMLIKAAANKVLMVMWVSRRLCAVAGHSSRSEAGGFMTAIQTRQGRNKERVVPFRDAEKGNLEAARGIVPRNSRRFPCCTEGLGTTSKWLVA